MTTGLFDLDGQVAVVTGGYGVLGGAIAEGLAGAGARVVLLGRNRDSAERYAEGIRERGRPGVEVGVVQADVTVEDDLRAAHDEVMTTFGRLDILINAAGGNVARARTDHAPVFGLPFDAFDEVVRLNLHGTVFPSLVFGEALARQGRGSIVNVSSMASARAISGVLGYSAAKSATESVTRWLAVDLARRHGDGVRVNAVAPGFFLTTQNRDVLVAPDGSFTERSRSILARTPAGRFGDPAEVVGPVVWLCSNAASFVTGAVIPVDGGFGADSGI